MTSTAGHLYAEIPTTALYGFYLGIRDTNQAVDNTLYFHEAECIRPKPLKNLTVLWVVPVRQPQKTGSADKGRNHEQPEPNVLVVFNSSVPVSVHVTVPIPLTSL
jgi:hypothetical protein